MPTSFAPDNFERKAKKHKPFWLKSIIVIGFIVALFIIGFVSFVGFYTYKIATGGKAELEKKYNSSFSADASLAGISDVQLKDADLTKIIRKENTILGEKNAPITIVAFVDYECPYTQESFPVFAKVLSKYGTAAKIIIKHFPLESIHPNAYSAALAANCAAEQNKLLDYHSMLLTNKKLELNDLKSAAQKLSLNTVQFNNCLDSKKYQKQVDNDMQDGIAVGVRGTPTFFVNTTKIEGVFDEKTWQDILLKAIK